MARISWLVSLTVLTVSFFGIFAILPTFKTIAKLSVDIKNAESINNKLAKKNSSLQKAEELYSQNLTNIPLINKVLPDEVEFERIAWQINWLAKDKQLELTTNNFGEFLISGTKAATNNEPQTIPIELSLKGNYNQLKDFSQALNKIDRLISFDQASLTNKKGVLEENQITMNVKLKAYFFPKND